MSKVHSAYKGSLDNNKLKSVYVKVNSIN